MDQWNHRNGRGGRHPRRHADCRRARPPSADCGSRGRRVGDDELDAQHPATTLARLLAAAECGLGESVKVLLAQLDGGFLQTRPPRS